MLLLFYLPKSTILYIQDNIEYNTVQPTLTSSRNQSTCRYFPVSNNNVIGKNRGR